MLVSSDATTIAVKEPRDLSGEICGAKNVIIAGNYSGLSSDTQEVRRGRTRGNQ